MGARLHGFKPILAALALGLAISAPAVAQEPVAPRVILPGAGVAAEAPVGSSRLDRLMRELGEAGPDETPRLVGQVRAEWSKSGSAAIDLLLSRGQDALDAGDTAAAIEHLTAAIDHAPGFAEAYEARATAYYFTGRVGPALDDLRQALVLNPQHFGALKGFAVLLEEMKRPEAAREAWDAVLALVPGDAEAVAAAERLDLMLGGQPL